MTEEQEKVIKDQVKEQLEGLKEKVTGKKSRNFIIRNAFKVVSGLATLVLSLGAGLLYMIINQGGGE